MRQSRANDRQCDTPRFVTSVAVKMHSSVEEQESIRVKQTSCALSLGTTLIQKDVVPFCGEDVALDLRT